MEYRKSTWSSVNTNYCVLERITECLFSFSISVERGWLFFFPSIFACFHRGLAVAPGRKNGRVTGHERPKCGSLYAVNLNDFCVVCQWFFTSSPTVMLYLLAFSPLTFVRLIFYRLDNSRLWPSSLLPQFGRFIRQLSYTKKALPFLFPVAQYVLVYAVNTFI